MWQRSEQRTTTVSPPNNFKLAFTNAISHPVLKTTYFLSEVLRDVVHILPMRHNTKELGCGC
ncbi:protein of unknown function [Citrobacter amalonaticus]|uniref:Uncharacterized protein n=1 Tax=Citrobacter amalonaticus TaxID=35703 RepID=A0AAX2BMW8_CITAM|nr:protein of unknown function [Citrobacter amalonaticus]